MSDYGMDAQRALGARLRDIRQSLGLSLAGVETLSSGEWKAVVVGSYERADRAITVVRLFELAALYQVPPWELLKPAERAEQHALTEGYILSEAQRHARAAADLLASLFNGGDSR